MPFTWAPEPLMGFLCKKLSIEKTLALELANGILSKWKDKTDRHTNTMFYVASLTRNRKLVDDMQRGDLSVDVLFSMSRDELQTDANQIKKKKKYPPGNGRFYSNTRNAQGFRCVRYGSTAMERPAETENRVCEARKCTKERCLKD